MNVSERVDRAALAHAKLEIKKAKIEAKRSIKLAKAQAGNNDLFHVVSIVAGVVVVLLSVIGWGVYAIYKPDQTDPAQKRYEMCVEQGMQWIGTNPNDMNAGACLSGGTQ